MREERDAVWHARPHEHGSAAAQPERTVRHSENVPLQSLGDKLKAALEDSMSERDKDFLDELGKLPPDRFGPFKKFHEEVKLGEARMAVDAAMEEKRAKARHKKAAGFVVGRRSDVQAASADTPGTEQSPQKPPVPESAVTSNGPIEKKDTPPVPRIERVETPPAESRPEPPAQEQQPAQPPVPEKKEELNDLMVGDALVEKKNGERITVTSRKETPEGVKYQVHRVAVPSGLPYDYEMNAEVAAAAISGGKYELSRAATPAVSAPEVPKPTAPAAEVTPEAQENKKDGEKPAEKKEKPPIEFRIGDTLTEKKPRGKKGSVITVLDRVEDENGIQYKVKRISGSGIVSEYDMNPKTITEAARGVFKLKRAKTPKAEKTVVPEPAPEAAPPSAPSVAEPTIAATGETREASEAQPPLERADEHIADVPEVHEILRKEKEPEMPHLERADENIADVPAVHEILEKEKEGPDARPTERADEHSVDVPEVQEILEKEKQKSEAPPLERADEHIAGVEEIEKLLAEEQSPEKPANPNERAEVEHIDTLPAAEKKSLSEGLANVGFSIRAATSRVFARAFEAAAQKKADGAAASRFAKGSTLDRVLASYAEFYRKREHEALQRKEQTGKSALVKGSGMAQGAGAVLKYGRILYDVASHGSLRYANPLRHVTLAAIFVGQNAEVLKESRLKAAEVIDASRVEDVDRAWEEAHHVYEAAKEKAPEGQQPDTNALEESYTKFLPQDIIDRLNRRERGEEFILTRLARKAVASDVELAAKYVQWAVARVGKKDWPQEKKQAKIDRIFTTQKKFLADLDRMVSDAGSVDQWAYWGRQLERASKNTANILMLDTARLLVQGALEHSGLLDRFTSDVDSVTAGPEEAPGSAGEGVKPMEAAGSAPGAPAQVSETEVRSDARQILQESELREAPATPGASGAPETLATDRGAVPSKEAIFGTSQVAAEAAEAAAQAPLSIAVEVHQGEGMIKAFGRTLEEQYGLEHERAMAIANRVWAEDQKDWYNVVHGGDSFKIELHGADAEALKTADLKGIGEKLAFNKESYSFEKSGIAPQYVEPSVPSPEQAAAAPAQASEPALRDIIEKTRHQVSPEAYSFLGRHRVAFNPATNELSYDLNDDGVFNAAEAGTSIKSEVFKVGGHLEKGVDHIAMRVDGVNGNLIIEAYGADGVSKEVFELTPGGIVDRARLEQQPMAVQIYEVTGRFGNKVMEQVGVYTRGSTALEAKYRGLVEFVGSQKALLLTKDKGPLMKLLHQQFDLSRSEARKLAKPLNFVFEGFRRGGVQFKESDTVASVLKRIEVKR